MHQEPSGVRIMAYTAIDDPSAHFQTTLYSGDGSTQSITNGGNSDLQPDWVWIKERSASDDHKSYDSSRGTTKKISQNDASTEENQEGLTAFNSDGFSLGSHAGSNQSGQTYVAWQWKANGGSTSANTSGDMTSTVQANTTAGFSILTYTGNGSAAQTVGHGLGATADLVIIKNRGQTDSWHVLFRSIATFDSGSITSTVFPTGAGGGRLGFNYTNGASAYIQDGQTNTDTETYIVYCFTSIQGYSKFGGYTGNGDADGPFIYLGFKPAWLLTKQTDGTDSWQLVDHKRDIDNIVENFLMPDSNAAETAHANNIKVDFLSNGFKCRATNSVFNGSGNDYIYMAFAEQPFVTSGGVPCTAR